MFPLFLDLKPYAPTHVSVCNSRKFASARERLPDAADAIDANGPPNQYAADSIDRVKKRNRNR